MHIGPLGLAESQSLIDGCFGGAAHLLSTNAASPSQALDTIAEALLGRAHEPVTRLGSFQLCLPLILPCAPCQQ